ncbi:alpha/beta fold hydrolase [Dyella solisilvae]|uniref:Alpha/beta fold hydrolase n=1 Tax=Dyella solisilvae TaxID=1920168 RepID=A0A370K6Q8_9GAMM|nr:alpha/beta fold hydrolase [Dyella solisilvae]RDI98322.1 alpha/beta fold hydrolase [Dyella solisilvae]
MGGQIILSHGSDSGPDATKVSVLAAFAESLGWKTQRPDYRSDDLPGYAGAVDPRVARLLAAIDGLDAPPVLVGSSMGAFVSGLASLQRPVAGLFLLATPSGIPGYRQEFDLSPSVPTLLYHGWQDDVCPPEGILAFASRRRLPLMMVDDDHRLGDSVERIVEQFGLFLAQLAPAA